MRRWLAVKAPSRARQRDCRIAEQNQVLPVDRTDSESGGELVSDRQVGADRGTSEVLPAAQEPELAGVIPVGLDGIGSERDLGHALLVAGLVRGRRVPCAAGVRP